MRLLAIETAAEACSAALYLDGEIRERFTIQPQRQSELILPMMDGLLAEAGLRVADLDSRPVIVSSAHCDPVHLWDFPSFR